MKKIIEDEKNNNPITVSELEDRMRDFLDKDYKSYFFSNVMKLSVILLSGFHLLLYIYDSFILKENYFVNISFKKLLRY